MKYLHKSITFKNEPDELKLWEWLKKMGHGDFNKKTKEYWKKEMEKDNKG
jgi:hypothetical protein